MPILKGNMNLSHSNNILTLFADDIILKHKKDNCNDSYNGFDNDLIAQYNKLEAKNLLLEYQLDKYQIGE